MFGKKKMRFHQDQGIWLDCKKKMVYFISSRVRVTLERIVVFRPAYWTDLSMDKRAGQMLDKLWTGSNTNGFKYQFRFN